MLASGNASLAIYDHDDTQCQNLLGQDLSIGWISTYGQ
jgi:hypothetical protein